MNNNFKDKEIKSGKEVINEFFSEIYNIENVDKKTVETLFSLYSEGKFTDTKIQNALEDLVQQELASPKKENE